MNDQAERFSTIPWEQVSDVARQKLIDNGEKRVRLLELSEGFHEKDWCERGHTGYVIDGSLSVDFSDHQESFGQGEPFLISSGQPHKASVSTGTVRLFLIDDV